MGQGMPDPSGPSSNGAAERAILELATQARTVTSALEHHFPEFKVMPNHKVYGWLIRHSAWLISRFLVKADGRTPYERLRGRECRDEIAEWAETVHYKVATTEKGKLDPQSALGLWLGKSLQSDEHLIGTERCRTIWRRPENKRWDRKLFDNFQETPWQPRGGPTAVPDAPATPGLPAPGTPVGSNRGVYITLGLQLKHGQTPDCPGCYTTIGNPRPHSQMCRERFEKWVAKDKKEAGAAGSPALPELEAGRSAERAECSTAAQGVGSTTPRVQVAPSQGMREEPLPWTPNAVVNPQERWRGSTTRWVQWNFLKEAQLRGTKR